MAPSVVVIGVGNELRGDDGAGLEVARRLADLGRQTEIKMCSHEGDGLALLELWDGAGAVVLVDTVRSGAAAGAIQRIDAACNPIPTSLRCSSSHSFGVAEAIELARILGTLPRTFVVYGVEGVSFEAGAEVSEDVAGAMDLLEDCVRQEVRALRAQRRST